MRKITTSIYVQPQATSHILMVRPARFSGNTETMHSNEFQQPDKDLSTTGLHSKVLEEFDHFSARLNLKKLDLIIADDTPEPVKPDALFPNNWVSFHQSGKVVLYPMMAENRRIERRIDIIDRLRKEYQVEEIVDLSYFEKEGKFLEGTGSMVLDRRFKIAYACLSPRTHPEVLQAFSDAMGYEVVSFRAEGTSGKPIYHTNVMMSVGDIFAVVCLEAIPDLDERHLLRSVLEETSKFIIEISFEQMNKFAGNILMVRDKDGFRQIVMSSQAYYSLNDSQRECLEEYGEIIHTDLSLIEQYGGGSARCMLAEIHLPRR
jgi:hypothetical protein